MVPPCVLRQRHAARLVAERRVPDRRDRAGVGGDLPRGAGRARGAGARRDGANGWSIELHGMIRLLTPPFDRTPHDPGYIKGYCRACARTAGNTRTARYGPCVRSPKLGDTERAAHAARDAEPVHHARDAGGTRIYQGGAVRRRRRCLRRSRRTSAAEAGPGTPDRPAGCSACCSSRSSASRSTAVRRSACARVCRVRGRASRCRTALKMGRRYTFRIRSAADGATISWHGSVEDGAIVIPVRRDGGTHRSRSSWARTSEPHLSPACSGDAGAVAPNDIGVEARARFGRARLRSSRRARCRSACEYPRLHSKLSSSDHAK